MVLHDRVLRGYVPESDGSEERFNGGVIVTITLAAQARVWSQSEFKEYIDKITQGVAIHPLEAPVMDEGLQLPHKGALLRQDILQASHAFYIQKCLGKGNERFVFVLDGDSGLALSFVSAFAPWIRDGRADVIVVAFDKHKSNDQRNILEAEGKADLELATGISRSHWNMIPAKYTNAIINKEIEELIRCLGMAGIVRLIKKPSAIIKKDFRSRLLIAGVHVDGAIITPPTLQNP